MKKIKFTKFGARLFCLFLLVSLVPLGIAGTIVYKYVHDRTKEDVLRQLQSTARSLNDQLDLLLSKRSFRVADFGSDGFIRDCVEQMSLRASEALMSPEYSHITEKLNSHLIINKKSLDPDILEIEILNATGKIIASTSREQVGKDKSHEDYFRTPFLILEQRGPYFAGTLNPLEAPDKLQLVFSTILTDKILHRPIGVIVTKVKGEILQDIIEIPKHQSNKEGFVEHYAEIYIVNSDKLLIASSCDSEDFIFRQIVDTIEVQKVLASRGELSGVCENYKGIRVLCAALFVPETNWVILTEKGVKEAFLPLTRIKYIFAISGGVALFLVFVFAFIISGSINAIIRRLIEGIRRISDGNLDQPIRIGRRKDELQELGESFNLMVEKLKESNNSNIKYITELKLTENALRENEEQLESIMDNTTAVIYLKDRQGKYILINHQFETIFHVTREDVIGKTDTDIFPEEMAKAFQANDRKVLEACAPMELEEIAPHDDGPHTYISIKFPLFDSNGVPDRICGISTDITERKHMEEVLRSSEEKFRKLVENLQDNYFFYSHNTDGIFTYVSPSISNILGYSTKEFLTHYSEYLTDNPINNEVVRHTELSIKGIKQPPYELEIYHKKGFVRILKVQEAPVLDKDCKVIAVEGIAEDITERKRVEEKLLSYQQQLKSLASSLSLAEERERRHIAEKLHDRIGQSLIVVKMKLEALRESEYSNGLNHILDDSYELLEKTIQDIRTLTFELSPPVLYELGFEPALEWLAEQFQKHHDIVIDFANDGKSKPLDDDMRALLYRSVRELFFNIVKHANAHNVIVSIRKKENKIQIDVKDDGVGFNPHDVSHSVTKTGGFGLFHVRERLEHFGGHLWIRSKPGLETQITLVAPLKSKEKRSAMRKKL